MIYKLKSLFFFCILLDFFFFHNVIYAIEDAKNPQITTNNYGQYVYAIWTKNDGTNDIVTTAYSSDWGKTWVNSFSLSESGQNALNPMITNNVFQNYIYAIWSKSNGTNYIIQFDASKNSYSWLSPINLSTTGEDASKPQIITKDIGKGVYVVWIRSDGSNNIAQFIQSSNFANSWSNIFDLSDVGQDAQNVKIDCSSLRQTISTVWQRSNGSNQIIQFRHCADPYNSWDSIVNLSETGQNAKTPEILSKNYAIHVVWVRSNGTYDIVQTRSSIDDGQTWTNVSDLSQSAQNAKDPKITADFSGKYAYCSWVRSNGTNDIVQVSSSNDYGSSWTSGIDLSISGQNASNPQIITDCIGQNVYVIWTRSNSVNTIIQFSYSNDCGTTWSSPIDLSAPGQNAKDPEVQTDFYGMNVYAIWARSDGTKDVIQFSRSYLYGTSWSNPLVISN